MTFLTNNYTSKTVNIFTCLFALISFSSLAQVGVLKGSIKLNNGEEVGSAVVHLIGTSHRVMADAYGQYELNNIPFGTYDMKVSSVEIEPKTIKVEVNKEIQKYNIKVVNISNKLCD